MSETKDLRDEFALAALSQCLAQCFLRDNEDLEYTDKDDKKLLIPQAAAIMAGEIADAMMAERAIRAEPQDEPWEAAHGYQEAFYKIAEILGVNPMMMPPALAFALVIVPRLREVMAEWETSGEYPECSGDLASCPENEGHGCCRRKS